MSEHRQAVVPDLTATAVPVEDLGAVHFIGIGGAGMSAIAKLFLARGVSVSGSDARGGPALDALAAQGASVFAGHDAAQVPPAGTVVVTSAARADNPELIAARRAGLRILHRSEALASLMLGRRAVAVAGTHGKTTTTGMITTVLRETGLDPSFAIGGQLTASGLGAGEGTSDIFVAEADESDGSFLLYKPAVAVITNIEPDHLDHYGSGDAVDAAFAAFARNVEPGGVVVACSDDAGVRRVLAPLEPEMAQGGVTFAWYGTRGAETDDRGASSAASWAADVPRSRAVRVTDFQPDGDGSIVTLVDGITEYEVRLRVPGLHNALNAAASWVVSTVLGPRTSEHAIASAAALGAFSGTKRRFEPKGTIGGVRVVDDYAHHPTEVAAVLSAARTAAGAGAVIAVFQPHLFSRTRIFARDFGSALGAADEVFVLDVYAAREDPEPGVTGGLITAAVPLAPSRVHFVPDAKDAPELVAAAARPGDLVLTIGAGDVTDLGPAILVALASNSANASSPAGSGPPEDRTPGRLTEGPGITASDGQPDRDLR